MNRQLVYPGQIPQDTDVLNSNKDAYLAIAKLAQGLFGNNTVVNGCACVPNSPAALNVLVNPGEIYSLQTTDASGYGSLGTDSTTILKQGILLAQAGPFNTPAPGTAGQSINYLIEAGFVTSDANSVVLPYYNASNPSVAWNGPGNSGAAQNTQRQDLCNIQIKAGTAATTGTQTTPAPDAGYVGLWVVTVANGQATVTAGNITVYPGAPLLHGPNNNPLFPLSNWNATTDPTTSQDNTQGYSVGSNWLNTSTNVLWICLNASTGAAVWKIDSYQPMPNYFVDPCCRVAQGPTALALSTSRQYGQVDLVQGWVSGAGAGVSAGTIVQDSASAGGGKTAYSCKLSGVTTTGANATIQFRRWLEANDAAMLANGTATFSVMVSQNTGSTITNATITVNKANAANNFGGGVTAISTSGNLSIPSGTPTLLTFSLAMGACANGVEVIVNIPVGAQTTKQYTATDWAFTPTTSYVVWEVPKFNDDLMRTYRYFEKTYDYSVAPGTSSSNNGSIVINGTANSNHWYLDWVFKATKVIAPTCTVYSPVTGTSGQARDGSGVADVSCTSNLIGVNSITFQNGGTVSVSSIISGHFIADARL